MQAGDFTNAIAGYRKSLALEPGREDAMINLAAAQVKSNNDSAAAETYLTIYRTNPSIHLRLPGTRRSCFP